MQKFIEPRLIDDFLTPQEIDALMTQYFTWMQTGWKSSRAVYEHGHQQHYVGIPSKHLPIDLMKLPHFRRNNPWLEQVWGGIQDIIGPRGLYRCYSKSYHYGQDAYRHNDVTGKKFTLPDGRKRIEVDDVVPDFETIIIYLTKDWKTDYYGHTVLYDGDEIAVSVMPKYNRCFVFDSAQDHASVPLSRMCPVNKNILVMNSMPAAQSDEGFDFLLKYSEGVPHSGKTFIEHLWNVYDSLVQFKVKRHVALAGLWHSAYGTAFYQKHDMSVFTREKVKEYIGEKAEDLVYRFCQLPKTRVERIIELEDVELGYIEVANLLDQNHDGRQNERLANLKLMIQKVEAGVSE